MSALDTPAYRDSLRDFAGGLDAIGFTGTTAGITPVQGGALGLVLGWLRAGGAREFHHGICTVRYAQPGLSGLYHGSTLAALERKGLAVSEWYDWLGSREYRLTPAGLEVRAALRARVNERLLGHGLLLDDDGRWLLPGHPEVQMTRSAAMRRTGIQW